MVGESRESAQPFKAQGRQGYELRWMSPRHHSDYCSAAARKYRKEAGLQEALGCFEQSHTTTASATVQLSTKEACTHLNFMQKAKLTKVSAR
jgi:hypothetical protein